MRIFLLILILLASSGCCKRYFFKAASDEGRDTPVSFVSVPIGEGQGGSLLQVHCLGFGKVLESGKSRDAIRFRVIAENKGKEDWTLHSVDQSVMVKFDSGTSESVKLWEKTAPLQKIAHGPASNFDLTFIVPSNAGAVVEATWNGKLVMGKTVIPFQASFFKSVDRGSYTGNAMMWEDFRRLREEQVIRNPYYGNPNYPGPKQ